MDHGKSKCLTNKITVFGIVQGVGFRPLVYRIAKKYGINGTVRNIGGLVEIIAQSSQEEFEHFLLDIKTNQSDGCEIVNINIEEMNSDVIFLDFKILDSSNNEEVSIIPPDLPVCPACQRELYRDSDRRFINPFISCMSCGPRYTIIEELPYDRHNTTMKEFSMCPSCNEEYTSPESRRFHAQTISCNDCGPYLIYQEQKSNKRKVLEIIETEIIQDTKEVTIKQGKKQSVIDQEVHETMINLETNGAVVNQAALDAAVATINLGGIVAVKGIGGYHFVCSPFMEVTVLNLRKLKGREQKPFAVMFETISAVKEYCVVSEEEKDLLESKARPIVLLYSKQESLDASINQQSKDTYPRRQSMAPSTNQGSIYCGAFLPYTPLQMLLTKRCGPLIMTSANISNKPIIKEDQEILLLKSPYLKGILYNKRRIVRSVDDSVAKLLDHKPQLIRRSRGYVPFPVFLSGGKENLQIFAAGGDLKAAFCLYKKGNAVVSQYFGDLEEITVMQEYESSAADLSRLLKISPDLVVCDYHPNYYSVRYAKSLGIPVLQVQHHHAHIASVMAEYDLKERVLGIAFDGTGYGMDGNIWGGEFLVCEGADFTRVAQLSYTPILGGDQSMRDAKKTAACFLFNAGLEEHIVDDRSDIILAALTNKFNTILTSSMGRLFDAVASILNIQQENRYEGECAANLEREAVLAIRNHKKPEELTFAIHKKSEIIEIDPKPLLESICRLRDTVDIGALALGFHYAVAESIVTVCEMIRAEQNINTVALSGGVFQNTILTEYTLKRLKEKGFRVYVNTVVPPNDGSISLGQTYIGLMK